MEGFWQATAGVLIAVVLCGVLSRLGKDVTALLSLAVCAMVLLVALGLMRPVVELIRDLEELSGLDEEWIAIVLKTVGIGLVSQFAGLICADAGNSAMAKAVEIAATAAVLWLSIPLMRALLELIRTLLGEL